MPTEIPRKFFKLERNIKESSKIVSKLRCAVWNVCSMNNKLANIMECILDDDPDITFLTETWLQSDKNPITAEIKTYGYSLLHNRRKDRQKDRGGGVGLLIKDNISAKQLTVKMYSSFEHSIVKVQLLRGNLLFLITIYRLQEIATSTFLEEFTELLDNYALSKELFIIAGDINIHMESDYASANQVKSLLDVYDLTQHVNCATHIKGHTLDIFITPNKVILKELCVRTVDLSHHFLISFNSLLLVETAKEKRTISYRSKDVDLTKFCDDVEESLQSLNHTKDLKKMIDEYNSSLSKVVNKHAPVLTKTISITSHAPWFDAEYVSLRKSRRKAERRYRKSRLDIDKKAYQFLRKEAVKLAYKKKKKSLLPVS